MESFTRRVTEDNMRGNTQDRTPRRVMVSILLTVYIMSSGVLVAAARSSTCRVAPSPIISRVGGVPRTSVALGYALEVEPYVPGLGLQPHVMNPCNGIANPS